MVVQFLGAATARLRTYQEINFQDLFCVIRGCRTLKLFHVELRGMYVTPKIRIL